MTERKRMLIFMNILVSCIASSVLSTALTTALPAIIYDFHVDVAQGQWLTSGYSLAMGIIMPLTAFLITRFPTRRLYLSGLVLTILGLVFCVIAPNFPLLMTARVLQACGNGLLTSMAQVIILSIFPPEKSGQAMGWYGLSIGAAPVIAPTLAGILVDLYGWRAIFYLVIVIMMVSLVCAWFVFEDVLETSVKKFDITSFAISILAFGGITLGVGNIGSYPFVSPQVLVVLLVGITAAAAFVYKQLHLSEPLLEMRVLLNKNYAVSVIGSMLLYFIMMGSSILLPLYVQRILGRSATVSGFVVLPGALAMAVISPFAGKIYDRLGIRPLFIGGAAAMMISNVCLFFVTKETPILAASLCNVVRSIAIGCLMMPLITWGTRSIQDKKLISHGTALLASLRTVAGAIGTAVFVGIMNYVAESSAPRLGENAMMHGFNVAFLWMGAASLLLLLTGIFCVKKSQRRP